jgi:hypothetical protein
VAEAPRDVVLGLLRNRGRVMLEGNREYFDGIDYVPPNEFIKFGGDSMTNTEEYRYQINEQEAYLLLLLAYWRSKASAAKNSPPRRRLPPMPKPGSVR